MRIHRDGTPDAELPLVDIARVEFRSATSTHLGWIRFVPVEDGLHERVDFSEWREGGFARLRDEVQRSLESITRRPRG